MDDSGKTDGSASPLLSNAFGPEYLEWLREGIETFGSGESEAAGPWELRHQDGAYPLFRAWEGFEHGDSPEAVFYLREAGLLLFAVRSATGRDPLVRAPDPRPAGGTIQPEGFMYQPGGVAGQPEDSVTAEPARASRPAAEATQRRIFRRNPRVETQNRRLGRGTHGLRHKTHGLRAKPAG